MCIRDRIETAKKEHLTVKALNDKLAAAKAAGDAGNNEQAIAILNEAIAMDANRDLLWFKLGDYDLAAKKYPEAVQGYQKAIQLASASPDPKAKVMLGAYNNNLGQAYGRMGKSQEAAAAYTAAAQADPAGAAQYYYNLGAVLTNGGKLDEAIAAFDKATAADPNKAEAYYWKGVNLLGKATVDKSGKMTAPEGTAEAFNKYLQLQPQGQFAQPAKDMLASIGASVETSYGTKKRKK